MGAPIQGPKLTPRLQYLNGAEIDCLTDTQACKLLNSSNNNKNSNMKEDNCKMVGNEMNVRLRQRASTSQNSLFFFANVSRILIFHCQADSISFDKMILICILKFNNITWSYVSLASIIFLLFGVQITFHSEPMIRRVNQRISKSQTFYVILQQYLRIHRLVLNRI